MDLYGFIFRLIHFYNTRNSRNTRNETYKQLLFSLCLLLICMVFFNCGNIHITLPNGGFLYHYTFLF